MEVGKTVSKLRRIKGMTLPELAELAGVSKGYLSQIEAGNETNPSLKILMKLARVLGTTVAELLGEDIVQAKNRIPDVFPPGLQDFIDEQRRKGVELHPEVLEILAQIKSRSEGPVDWPWLYKSILVEFEK